MEDPQILAGRLRRARQALGLTLQQLSERTNLSVSYLSQLEHASRLNPSRQVLEDVARALGLTPATLMAAEGEAHEAKAAPAPQPLRERFLARWSALPERERERLALAPAEERFALLADFLLTTLPDRFPDSLALARHLGMSPEQLQDIRFRGAEVGANFLTRMAETMDLPLSFLAFGTFTDSPGPMPSAGEILPYLAAVRLAVELRVSPARLEALIRSLS